MKNQRKRNTNTKPRKPRLEKHNRNGIRIESERPPRQVQEKRDPDDE